MLDGPIPPPRDAAAGTTSLLIANARVSGRPQDPPREAVLVHGERIAAVGELDELRGLAGPGVRELDVGGRRVVPGLIDSHAHVLRAGLSWEREVHWSGVPSLEQALALVRERARALAPGDWIPVIGGWHPAQFAEARSPTRADLDLAAPENPCYVQVLYDEAVLNAAALSACGFAADNADPPGGSVERDRDGSPTGVVRGHGAFRHCLEAMGRPGRDAQALSIRSMLRELAALGLTGALDPGGIGVVPETYEPLYDVWRAGSLSLRLRLFLGAGERGAERRQIEDWMRLAPRGSGDELLRVTGIGEIVVFRCWDGDGLTPFAVDPDSFREFTEISTLAAAGGWPMHVHAIRDESAGAIIDAWEQVDRRHPIAGLRFCLAHAEGISERNLKRARALGLGLALQDRMLMRASGSAAGWGERAVAHAPPLRRMIELGFPIGGGTDATVVSSINPWLSLWWMVSGRTFGGPRRVAEHRLTRAQALGLYTHGSAWFSAEEGVRGRLAVGQLADIAVLDDDFFGIDEDAIPALRSDLTLVGGRLVHASERFAGIEAEVNPGG
jgi:predicted amidohydrolase YtcJ